MSDVIAAIATGKTPCAIGILRLSGQVYVRKGSSSQPVSDEAIREIIIQTSGISYETCRSMNQELSFTSFTEKMKERKLDS